MKNDTNKAYLDSAFPMYSEIGNLNSSGLSKLEYTAIKIFCASLTGRISPTKEGSFNTLRKLSIEQAKLLLQEIEEESK